MEQLGRYQLHRRIAIGGMAEVFLARTASLDGFDKDLVIKRIRPELCQDGYFVSLFLDEARLSLQLAHPNVVHVYDFGQADGSYYLALELIHGADLSTLLALPAFRHQGLPIPVAAYIVEQACRGLDYAHTKRGRDGKPLEIIHRDVSPKNILVSLHGEVKVTDFGIAKAAGRIAQTEAGRVVGKIAYMSPEQATDGHVDLRTDVYAAGIVLWELVTGRTLFDGELTPELIEKIRGAVVPPASQFNRKVPRRLDKLLAKALAKESDERFESAKEMAAALRDFLADEAPKTSSDTLAELLDEYADALPKLELGDTDSQAASGPAARISAVREPARTKLPSETGTKLLTPRPASDTSRTATADVGFHWSPEFVATIEEFRRHPSLWLVLHLGELCAKDGESAAAVTCFREAAVHFAQNGLLAPALLAAHRMIEAEPGEATRRELEHLPSLVGSSIEQSTTKLAPRTGPVAELLAELFSHTPPHVSATTPETPFLSLLDGRAFAELATSAPCVHYDEGELIVQQGDRGRELFLLASGRVMVRATGTGGQSVFLASLSAGDIFGENGFFTGAPRSAAVEVIEPVDAFAIDLGLYQRVMSHNHDANQLLLRFYKQRIVDAMLATSPIFAPLTPEARRVLLERFRLRFFEAGATVLREGELSDQIYVVKSGEAVVSSARGGSVKELARLGPGTLFGEVAAMRQIARTATVTAHSRLELLELSRADFQAVLDARPEIKRQVATIIAERARENLDKMMPRLR